ncbi:ECF transporter S component [uncultured Corynebacterium sp.]|uniref:ECF transporter S component n=1 Tax=uncultured Corynebacterium sp. TaxID=159447 RepID=UPI0025F01992|nr:ECF transporter S component [uncultured Corynebacterium sp.]
MSPISLSPARTALVAAGALVVFATWIYLVLVRPTDWESVAGSTEALITLVGYLLGAVLLLTGTLSALPARTIAIIPVALVLNIVVGEIIGSIGVPLYIDSVGTVLVAALAGRIAGLATGTLSSVVWGLLNPAALPFAAVSAATGYLSGLAIEKGAFRSWWRVILSGAIIGIISGMLAAPVAAFVYGGTAGLGTGAVVSAFREAGNSLIASVTLQSFISDPLDKALVFLIVWAAVKALPKRTLESLRPKGMSATSASSATSAASAASTAAPQAATAAKNTQA